MAAMGASRMATRADDSAWAMAVRADDHDEVSATAIDVLSAIPRSLARVPARQLRERPSFSRPLAATASLLADPSFPSSLPSNVGSDLLSQMQDEMLADRIPPPVSQDAPDDEPPASPVTSQPLATSPNSGPAKRVRTRKSSKQLKALDENGFPIYNIPRSTSWEKLEEADRAGKNSRTRGQSSDRLKRKSSKGAVNALDNLDEHEKWIHRDKLMQIESKELADIGGRMGPRSSQAPSRARSTRTGKSSVDVTEQGEEMPDGMPTDESRDLSPPLTNKKIRTQSPSPEESFHQAQENQHVDSFAAAVGQRNVETPSRPGTSSRLPVAAQDLPYESPVSVQRETPEHIRSGSRELNKQKQRLRSQSGGRELAAESASDSASGAAHRRTTSRSRGPPSTSRKVSGANGRKGSSSSSNTSPQRPGTSGRSRPGTRTGPPNPINRPEGDAPWLNQMYKPDPRLPPDQQMLPTHARRMVELQREADARARQQAANNGEKPEEFVLMDSEEEATQAHLAQRNGVQEGTSKRDSRRDSKRDSLQNTQWPLRTPTPQEQQERLQHRTAGHESPPMVETNWSHRRNGTIDSVAASQQGYSLTPTVRSPEEQQRAFETQQHRLSQRSRLSQNVVSTGNGHSRQLSDQEWKTNAAQAPVHQPVTLTPEPEKSKSAAKKKEGGCLACCTVM